MTVVAHLKWSQGEKIPSFPYTLFGFILLLLIETTDYYLINKQYQSFSMYTFADFEQVIIKISHFADFEQVIDKISHFANSLGRNRIPKFFVFFYNI